MRDAVIVEAVRTPTGKRNGGLAGIHSADLSAHVLRALVERTGVDPGVVDDVVWGCVSQIGEQTFDIKVFCNGGGINGQAGAVKHGIAKCLVAMNEELRTDLRSIGALTRDSRVKERKKYGRKRARRGFQFSKR